MISAEWDVLLFRAINNFHPFPFLDWLAVTVANIQQVEACTVLCAAFLYGMLFKKFKVAQTALVLLLAFMFLDSLISGMKLGFNRPRPAEALEGVRLIGEAASGSSFPSSQAALASMLFTYIYLVFRKWPFLWLGLVVVVGFLRVYQGVHYPSDILAGWLIGVMIAGVAFLLYRFIMKGMKFYSSKRGNA